MAEADPRSETDALRALEERIERATRAAERLLAEARAPTAEDSAGGVPPRGWQRREAPAGSPALDGWIDPDDARLLFTLLSGLPPELERRVVTALRELLLAVRALIDWCVERAERRSAAPAEVQDIPIL
jgi:hypothetical protein